MEVTVAPQTFLHHPSFPIGSAINQPLLDPNTVHNFNYFNQPALPGSRFNTSYYGYNTAMPQNCYPNPDTELFCV
jgi:hypothetical protein